MSKAEDQNRKTSERTITTVCNCHCGGACPLNVHVKDDKIVRIETDVGAEPQFRACLKGRAYRQRVYAPDRLVYPMKRTGERGKGEFERITWDEALTTIAAEIQRVKESYGPPSILFLGSLGDVTWLHNAALTEELLIKAGGYSGSWGSPSGEGALLAMMTSYGMPAMGNSREDLLNSRLIILWGWNPAVACNFGNTRLYLAKAREAGARIIVVDPRYTDSAAIFADQWISIKPGTDTALLTAMAYVMIAENLHDKSFLATHTMGFEKFQNYVLGNSDGIPKTPAWAEDITGVPKPTISSFAREFAAKKPAALIDGFAAGRSAHGEQFHRATITLAAMTGNIGIQGGSAPGGCSAMGDMLMPVNLGPFVSLRMQGEDNPVDLAAPPRKDAIVAKRMGRLGFYMGVSQSRVHRSLIADAIIKGRQGGYPADYKLLYLVNINYLNQIANTNKIAQALQKLEFIVAQEQFLTPTAKFADIILPNTTFMERNDVTTGGIGPFYGYMNKVIEPVGEARSHYEIVAALAEKLGIDIFHGKAEEDWLKEIVHDCRDIPDYDTFKTEGVHKVTLPVPFICFEQQIKDPAHNPFPTQSGKIEIYSQEIDDLGDPLLPPIPTYIEPWEGRNDPLVQKYPLQLVTTHTKRRAHTQFDNLPILREIEPQAVQMNPADARKRAVDNGDMVKVFNERGAMIIPANVTERIMPGVVDIPQGAWYSPDENGIDRGGCANVLTKDVMSPGGAFCFNTGLVQVEKVKE